MKELFKNVLVVCAAASTFAGGAFVSVNLVNSYVDSRIAASNASGESGNTDSGQVDSLPSAITKLKKLLK